MSSASTEIVANLKKKKRPRTDSQTEQQIIERLQAGDNPSLIALECEVCRGSVSRIKKRLLQSSEPHTPWFQEHILNQSPQDFLKDVIKNKQWDNTASSTDLAEEPPEVSKGILDHHTFKNDLKNESLLSSYKSRATERSKAQNYYGFTIFPPNLIDSDTESESGTTAATELVTEASADNAFLEQLLTGKFDELMTPIFQHVQNVAKSSTLTRSPLDRRMGDQKRKHVQFSVLLADARNQLQKAEDSLATAKKNLSSAEEYSSTYYSARASGRSSTSQKSKMVKSSQDPEKLKLELESARNAQAEKEKTLSSIEKVIKLISNRFKKIRKVPTNIAVLGPSFEYLFNMWQVSPYKKVEQEISDAHLLSTLLSEPYASPQGVHLDSLKEGMSLVTSLGKEQHITVLLNGFRAVCIINRILCDREAAFHFVRQMLAGIVEWKPEEWSPKSEERCWNFLCDSQFKKEKLGVLQAVRVPCPKGYTIAIDNRTPHGGSSGTTTRGFRIHTYGSERSPLADEQDYAITIDLLRPEYGLFPLCHWAQTRNPLFKISDS